MPTITTLTKDQSVVIKYTTMTGTVTGARMDPDTLAITYLVNYTDVQTGEPQSRYFTFEQLEAV